MQIATDLYAGLQNFFALHTELQARPLFITGESYAGKYVPAIGMQPADNLSLIMFMCVCASLILQEYAMKLLV